MAKRTVKRLGNNSWVTEAMHGEVAHAFDEAGVYFDEYKMADQMPTMKCPEGHDAWFKPSIGTYKCRDCGTIHWGDGQWI